MGLATIDPHSHKVQTKFYKIPMSRSRTESLFVKYRSGVRRDQPHNFIRSDCGFIPLIEVCGEN